VPRCRRRTLPRAAVVMVCALIAVPTIRAQQARPAEYEVKATYLYNFARFVEWPSKVAATQDDSFAICVLGQDPFGPTLDATLAGETVAGKSVVARRISKPQEGIDCRILFISSSERTRLKETLTTLEKTSVLTVSDMPDFSRRGFVFDGSRVRFEINLTTAAGAGLTLSSDLLKVASKVRRDFQPGG
jgi:uncharacterized protein DUF4154